MTQKFKVGDKVRILRGSAIHPNTKNFKDGEVVVVNEVLEDCCGIHLEREETGEWICVADYEFKYIEKVDAKPTKKQRLSELERQVAELQAEVASLKEAQKPTEVKIRINTVQLLTPNERRRNIIAEAKAYIEAQKRDFHGKRLYQVGPYMVDAEFIVNEEKRAVTALLYWHSPAMKEVGEPRELKAKGIAKCAPDDVFNADIGKAIALGRALGLDVKRFEQAVKPTELVVGHDTKGTSGFHFGKVTKLDDRRAWTGDTYWRRGEKLSRIECVILDDTEAQY